MVKKIIQDVLPPEKRSIRHIPLPQNRKLIESFKPDDKSEKTEKTKVAQCCAKISSKVAGCHD